MNIVVIFRYKDSEESLFQEKESVRSQLEMMNEERAKLSKVGHIMHQLPPSLPLTLSLSVHVCVCLYVRMCVPRSVRSLRRRMQPSLGTRTSDRESSTMPLSKWKMPN